MRTTGRLIELLATVNGTAIDNDLAAGRTVGQHIQEVCHEAADRIRLMRTVIPDRGGPTGRSRDP
jgi:hypothetical protein